MITLSITDGSHTSVLLRIHAGSTEDAVIYGNILDCISNDTSFLVDGETDNPTIIYFENFEYKIVRDAPESLVSARGGCPLIGARPINQTPSGVPLLPANERLLRTSGGRLLVDSRGLFVRVR